jgi:hypothetical protein
MNQDRQRCEPLGLVGDFGDAGGVGEYRDGPAFDGVTEMADAMGGRTGKCGEQITRPHILGSQRHTGDTQIGDHRSM